MWKGEKGEASLTTYSKKENIIMSETIRWRTNWQEALAEAKKANRPLALEFFLDG
jgi:hypothetical protein